MALPVVNAHHISFRTVMHQEGSSLAQTTGQKDTRCNALSRILTADTTQTVRKAHQKLAQKSRYMCVRSQIRSDTVMRSDIRI